VEGNEDSQSLESIMESAVDDDGSSSIIDLDSDPVDPNATADTEESNDNIVQPDAIADTKTQKEKVEEFNSYVSDGDYTEINKGIEAEGFDMPVSGGTITQGFGMHDHPVHKGVKTRNNGVDIAMNGQTDDLSDSDGKVTSITKLTPNKYAVTVRSGDYTFVYNNIPSKDGITSVGLTVNKGDIIAGMGEDGTLNFQVWKGKTKLDPKDFIKN